MTTRIGWIGCGVHANEMLLPQVTRHNVVLQAICDLSPESLATTGRRYGVAPENRMSDWRALLARTDIDAVGLAIGPNQHHEVGLAAIARGLPLFIEKPPALASAAAPDAVGAQLADAAANPR